MFIRFMAFYYEVDGKKMVDVYDHQTKRTTIFTLRQYRRIEKILSHQGGIIYTRKEWL